MDETKKYIEMCEKAEEIQKALKDKFDYRSQGYCTKHKCLIGGDEEGSAQCLEFRKLYTEITDRDDYDAEEKLFAEECCDYSEFWIGLPYQDQLCSLSKLSWKEFDIACLKYDVDTKEMAGIRVVMNQFNKKWFNGDWV